MKFKSYLTALLLMVAGVVTTWAQTGQILGMTLTVQYNGSPAFTLPVISEGWPVLDLTDELTTSLVIQKIDVQTSGTVSGVAFTATMYKTEKGLQPDDGWRTFPLNDMGDGQWQLDLGPGVDLIDEGMTSPRTFQFYLKAQDGAGNDIFFNNGGQDYKLLFIPGEGELPVTNKIKSLTLTINCDGEQFTQSFPSEGWEPLVIPGKTKSIKILRAEIETDAELYYAGFIATMYNAEDGWQHDNDAWTTTSLQNEGNGIWAVSVEGGFELVESEWLETNKTKTFEFFIYAEDQDKNAFQYDNGGSNYKVTFSTGPDDGGDDRGTVSFLEISTATVRFIVNDEPRGYIFDGDGARQPADMPLGDLYSLRLDGYYLTSLFTSDADRDVTMQYKVYEAGGDGIWNGIKPEIDNMVVMWNPDAQENMYQMFCIADELNIDLCSGLEYGKDYVLEIMYQVIAYGNYYFFGRDLETTRFPFHYENETGIKALSQKGSTEGVSYNLGGQRVGKDYKGIVITDGKKEMRR